MAEPKGGCVQSRQDALAAMRQASASPVAAFRLHLASVILGRRLYCVMRDVLLAEGRREEAIRSQLGRGGTDV